MIDLDLEVFLIGLLALGGLLFVWGGRQWSPVVSVLNRWVSLMTFACCVAYWDQLVDWSGRPAWVMLALAVLGWFFCESLLLWVFLGRLSFSSVPLFPRFRLLAHTDGMPIHEGFSRAQAQLESMGYTFLESMALPLNDTFSVWSRVFEKDCRRVQLLLMPRSRGRFQLHVAVHGLGADGVRYTLDNLYLPNVAASPKDQVCLRRPWARGMRKLIKRHEALMAEAGGCQAFTYPPCEDLNRAQAQQEAYNAQGGLLRPSHVHSEHGRITPEGRYRIWKGLFWLHYFGRAAA